MPRNRVKKIDEVTKQVVKGGAYKPRSRITKTKKNGEKRRLPQGTRRSVAGPGRPKGSPNKFPGLLKEALIEAAEYAGRKLPPIFKRGEKCTDLVNYLAHQAYYNPQSFLPLLGRVLPLQIENDGKNLVIIDKIEMVVVDGRSDDPVGAERGDEVLTSIEGTAEVLAFNPSGRTVPRRVGREGER